MKIKMIIGFLALIFMIFVLDALMRGGESLFEGLANEDKQRIKKILQSRRMTNDSKIKAITELKINDPQVNAILNRKNKDGTPTSNMHKTVDFLKLVA